MVNYYIYATDDSGSTEGEYYFNSKAANTLKDFTDDVQIMQAEDGGDQKDNKIVYLHWSDRCIEVNREEVVKRYAEQSGNGLDTLPHTVLDWFKNNLKEDDVIKLLYIITDGQVMPARIRPCDPNMKIDNVMFYAFNHYVTDIDMSVASMFICKNKSYTVYCNGDLVDRADLSNPYNYDEINIENFHRKKDELKSYIKLQFLTKTSSDGMALNEIKKLKRLRKRLFDAITIEEETSESVIDLNVKDKDVFIRDFKKTPFYKTIMNLEQQDMKHNVEACISAMINYINNDKKSFEFDNLKFAQKFDTNAEAEDVPDVNYENVEEIAFPDIIMYNDTGVPVLLLTHYNLFETILFNNAGQTASFSKFRNALECPLCLMFDDNFKESIEYYYNLDAFKGMIDSGIRVGPRTRRDFAGAIVPLEEFDDYNDYVLACTYFDGRKVPYNKGLLYYVIWKTCEKLEYIEPSIVDYVKAYVMKRIAKTECYLGLSGVSIYDPLIRVNLTTALWYCVELSSILFKNDPVHFTKEKMRMYSNVAEYMKEILTWFQYSIDKNSVDMRADIFKHLNRLKRIGRPQDKAMFILEQIFVKKNNFLVSEFANADNIYKLNYVKMDHKKIVDESVLGADANVNKYAHFMNRVDTFDDPLCGETLRPRFVTKNNKSFYEELMTVTSQVSVKEKEIVLEPTTKLNLSRILSLYKLYIGYVADNLKYPTYDEYNDYVLKKKQFVDGKPVIFPTNIFDCLENVYGKYQKVISDENIDVKTFVKITADTQRNRAERIKLEKPIGFAMEKITDLIRISEDKVKLKTV